MNIFAIARTSVYLHFDSWFWWVGNGHFHYDDLAATTTNTDPKKVNFFCYINMMNACYYYRLIRFEHVHSFTLIDLMAWALTPNRVRDTIWFGQIISATNTEKNTSTSLCNWSHFSANSFRREETTVWNIAIRLLGAMEKKMRKRELCTQKVSNTKFWYGIFLLMEWTTHAIRNFLFLQLHICAIS